MGWGRLTMRPARTPDGRRLHGLLGASLYAIVATRSRAGWNGRDEEREKASGKIPVDYVERDDRVPASRAVRRRVGGRGHEWFDEECVRAARELRERRRRLKCRPSRSSSDVRRP